MVSENITGTFFYFLFFFCFSLFEINIELMVALFCFILTFVSFDDCWTDLPIIASRFHQGMFPFCRRFHDPHGTDLLKLWILKNLWQVGGHHTDEDFAVRGKEPKDEVQIYTWMDATLRELTDLVREVSLKHHPFLLFLNLHGFPSSFIWGM